MKKLLFCLFLLITSVKPAFEQAFLSADSVMEKVEALLQYEELLEEIRILEEDDYFLCMEKTKEYESQGRLLTATLPQQEELHSHQELITVQVIIQCIQVQRKQREELPTSLMLSYQKPGGRHLQVTEPNRLVFQPLETMSILPLQHQRTL